MVINAQHAQFRLAGSLLLVARYLWYSPAFQLAVLKVLS
jgi:hypothetical protein